MKTLLISLLLASTVPATAQVSAPREKATRIILIGDSTTAAGGGWGDSFCQHHVAKTVECVNLGRGGSSSASYREDGSWDAAMAEIWAGDTAHTYVLFQFGHNDQPPKTTATDPATEFPHNLRRYVEEVRAAGAHPVLLTPLTRRRFVKGQLETDLVPWANATRKVATQMRVPLIDLYARSQAAVLEVGPTEALKFSPKAPTADIVAASRTGTTAGNFDYSHLGPQGAAFFAKIVTRELSHVEPELRKDLMP